MAPAIKRTRAASTSAEGPQRKKIKLTDGTAGPASATGGFSSGKASFTPNAKLKRTAVKSKAAYLDKRCDRCNGKTVEKCIGMLYTKGDGEKAKYSLADLRYDVQGGRLSVVGGGSASAGTTKLKVGKRPPLSVAKDTASVASLAGGVKLRSGAVMPAVGFGTYKLADDKVCAPVLAALKSGYRLIDTAQVYENEKGVGAALRKSGLGRNDVFIETKVWRSSHGYDRTMKAFGQSCRRLGVDYIDLYVIHWPGCKTGWPLK